MSWRVNVIENTLKPSKQCVKELWNYNKKNKLNLWYDKEDVLDDETLFFNEDNMEWIDFLSNYDPIIDILKNNKVKGEVTFASEEAEGFWGHRFDGNGGYKRLKGILTFVEEE